MTAWQAGATGRGVTIAIVDTGIDSDSPEFAGRISPASADVAGSRTIEGEDDHGTQVALVAAAARNNTGVLGIAFDATVQVLRADLPGTCATEGSNNPNSGCKFSDGAIAAGVDRAVTAGARVINLSIGGSDINATLRGAIGRAASAGVVVVVSAGNEGDSTSAGDNPNEVNPFASSVRSAGNGNVILAGSVNENGTLSAFSNRAGSNAAAYLSALGERVCCVYENGVLKVTTLQGQQFVSVVSGTSFSAPQISGAVALLAQAFPNLTGLQIVDLLLRTARDAGIPGTDSTYGRGILDIANAFAPQGPTALAGTTALLPLGDDMLVTGRAMGDAGAGAALGAVILDGYSRAYALDLAQSLRHAQVAPRLTPALAERMRQVSAGGDALNVAFSIDNRRGTSGWIAPLRLVREDADAARVLATRVTARLSPGKQFGFAFGEGSDGLAAQLRQERGAAFLVAGTPGQDLGFTQARSAAFAYRQTIGGLGLTLAAERGAVVSAPSVLADSLRARRLRDGATRLGVTLDRQRGGLDGSLGLSWLHEDRTILGARLNDALGAGGGADTLFVDARVGWQLARDWRLGAAWRGGWTAAQEGGRLVGGTRLLSQAFAVDLEKTGFFAVDDRLAGRLAQPLRVERGGLMLQLPVAYDYATLQTTFGERFLPLTPHGREWIGELAWRGAIWGGNAGASLYYRSDPGHFAAIPDDQGVALQWSADF
ncbi:MAG: S8 family peptidase [Novosphingobium sp.]